MDQPVGLFVADENLLHWVKAKRPSQLDSDLAQVDQCAGAMAIFFVQRKLLARPDGFGKICNLGFWIGGKSEFLFETRNVGGKALE